MAEELKPVVAPEATPVTTETVAETKPTETTTAATETPVAEAKATETPAETAETAVVAEDKPAEATADKAVEETKKDEVKPIEAGALEHKATPASFPKNVFYSKNHFWFGSEALPTEKLSSYLKHEKATDVAHHVTAWATETGKGLLFISKESDKSTPTGAIQLSEASEPTIDGTHKFTVTSKGHKHTFKAPTAADRDNWVAQLKLKITEAKELASTVTESETYKKTLETLKPTSAVKKEEKPVVAPVAAEPVKEEAKEETPKEEAKEEDKKEEVKEEKKDEPKPRSSSKKRTSIFGSFLGKKEEAKKETPVEDKPAEDKPVETTGTTTTAIPVESTPATEPVKAVEDKPVETPAEEVKKEEKKEEVAKPAPTKRSSIFGTLSGFGKKKSETEAAPATPAKETPAVEAEPVAESAPVIPAVETSEPLSTEVTSPATAPTETTEVTPATNGETKKDVKSDKRKSSLPFTFGKKDKSAPTSDEEGEKTKSPPFFSKLRQTVKGKGKAPVEKPAEDKPAETTEVAADKPVEEVKTEETPVEKEEITPAATTAVEAEKPAAAAPAPVTAAA